MFDCFSVDQSQMHFHFLLRQTTNCLKLFKRSASHSAMDIRFDGKRALVTGAGKGIGRALTLKLVEGGAEVIAVSRTQSDLDSLKTVSSKIYPLCLDIGNWDATKASISEVLPVDLLVNNAAIMDVQEYGELTEEDVDRTLNINVKSVVNITQMVVNDMKARGQGGSIVNVSSTLGLYAAPSYGVYCGSKGAVHQLTRSMAVEFGPHKIRVNSVNPTAVRTRMAEKEGLFDPNNAFARQLIQRTPLRRFAEVEDVVNSILFLLSDKASMVTGIAMVIDGGLSVSYT
ncbi:carbonyl reductase [NADPH] 2-like [Uloborus diversus]|uniref:carbonyl reductase [NADPH] 2-like n=1 Tax=Uloborus diversus TaxID=327109 RepID=UPI00240A02D7|nr:carbonyl reductase [NADPH] 2-like [Uloborus diversus]